MHNRECRDFTQNTHEEPIMTQATLTQTAHSHLVSAILFLAGNCDGASSRDNRGFARIDTYRGRQLAAIIKETGIIPAPALNWAKQIVIKYQNQLKAGGFDVQYCQKAERIVEAPKKKQSPTIVEMDCTFYKKSDTRINSFHVIHFYLSDDTVRTYDTKKLTEEQIELIRLKWKECKNNGVPYQIY